MVAGVEREIRKTWKRSQLIVYGFLGQREVEESVWILHKWCNQISWKAKRIGPLKMSDDFLDGTLFRQRSWKCRNQNVTGSIYQKRISVVGCHFHCSGGELAETVSEIGFAFPDANVYFLHNKSVAQPIPPITNKWPWKVILWTRIHLEC